MEDDIFNVKLLEFFVALVNSGSLLRTGKKFGYSAAGSSRALERLRRGFKHPLFISTNKGLTPTAYATTLQPQVMDTIKHLRRLTGDYEFDPEECTRTFQIAARGFLIGKIVKEIVPKFHKIAPKASIALHPSTTYFKEELENRTIDMAWVLDQLVEPDMHYMVISEIKGCLISAKNHPLAIRCEERGFGPSDEELAQYPLFTVTLGSGKDRGILPVNTNFHKFAHFLSVVEIGHVLPLISASDYLCIAQEDEAKFAMENYDVTYMSLENTSFKGKVHKGVLVWNDLTHKDPEMVWFRSLIRDWTKTFKG